MWIRVTLLCLLRYLLNSHLIKGYLNLLTGSENAKMNIPVFEMLFIESSSKYKHVLTYNICK